MTYLIQNKNSGFHYLFPLHMMEIKKSKEPNLSYASLILKLVRHIVSGEIAREHASKDPLYIQYVENFKILK